ncbi:hypothetical protein LZ30DRAFT_582034 [Colletotrichum cereale]|nr:hypothetical protein LZ30DRAFT_582034 [Colletotrichum cereale]
MGGFDKVTDLAQQLTDKKQTGRGQQRQQDSSQNAGSNQQWTEVGLEAKKVFADYQADQADQAAGKGLEYDKIGGVAQKAVSAYNIGGEKKNLADIGKGFADGSRGSGGVEKVSSSDKVGDVMSKSGGDQRGLEPDESNVDGRDETRSQKSLDDPLESPTADAKGYSASGRLSGQEAPYETAGLGSQTERDTQDGTVFEKADLDEDEGVCTSGQSKRREVTSGTAAIQGKKKDHLI